MVHYPISLESGVFAKIQFCLIHLFFVVVVAVLLIPGGLIAAEGDDIPPPEDFVLRTKDGLSLACTYYEGTEGKHTIPIILLHGWEGKRHEFSGLAKTLQEKGHAVIVPDLRGHGGSTRIEIAGREVQIDPKKMRLEDIQRMVQFDLDAVRKHLIQENNDEKLNIEMLCLVGADMGAVVALNWALRDWSWPQLPNYKQGQDVKAFVLLSPPQSFKGLQVRDALQHRAIRRHLSALLVVGTKDKKGYSSAKRIYDSLKRFHPSVPPSEEIEKRDLFFVRLQTSLKGTKLLREKSLRVEDKIVAFINRRLVNKRDRYQWTMRRNPLGD